MKKRMTDEQMYLLLEEFANDHSLAVGGGLKVRIGNSTIEFTPDYNRFVARYEDAKLLSELIKGAEHFLIWYRRKYGKA